MTHGYAPHPCPICGGEPKHERLDTIRVGSNQYRARRLRCTGCGTLRHGGGDHV
jgi:formate dehydrogenase maturation protein FdhE